ncbi:Uu.00g038000.m01.CDS01 [Anthostomella pinea]|uniref:Uu.00g038000.m01.CDS01 n=1 Tax=Anthostomella pinea TaxID=933095 RepID=A0AAI8VA86_9PEZI|nr:Uu.00g038000.m01.CDS01 [Anthostomella pinea]
MRFHANREALACLEMWNKATHASAQVCMSDIDVDRSKTSRHESPSSHRRDFRPQRIIESYESIESGRPPAALGYGREHLSSANKENDLPASEPGEHGVQM